MPVFTENAQRTYRPSLSVFVFGKLIQYYVEPPLSLSSPFRDRLKPIDSGSGTGCLMDGQHGVGRNRIISAGQRGDERLPSTNLSGTGPPATLHNLFPLRRRPVCTCRRLVVPLSPSPGFQSHSTHLTGVYRALAFYALG